MRFSNEYLLYVAFYTTAALGNDDVDFEDLDSAAGFDRPLGCYATAMGVRQGKLLQEPLTPAEFVKLMLEASGAMEVEGDTMASQPAPAHAPGDADAPE